MADAHVFQAVQPPELDMLGLVAIHLFSKKRVRYLRLVAQNNMADEVIVTLITVVASIDPELFEKPYRCGRDRCGFGLAVRTKASWNIWNLRKNEMRLLRPSSSRPRS
jgi:hypothetical protein